MKPTRYELMEALSLLTDHAGYLIDRYNQEQEIPNYFWPIFENRFREARRVLSEVEK